jgi:two-component system chemotaxis response regulator CheB
MPETIPSTAQPRSDVRVLIVDDSVVVRRVLKRMLESDPGIRVIGMAADGGQAVELTAQLRPDLVTMDLMMPGMDGLEATARIMAYHPTPVLFFSSYFDRDGVHSRFDALAAGALDVVEKPTLMPDDKWEAQADALVRKVRALARIPVIAHIRGSHLQARKRTHTGRLAMVPGRAVDVAAIGVSSGGPRVLNEILPALPPDFALGLIIVQHMAEGFMPGLIEWLQQRCPLPVKVAAHGDAIVPGRILFAPDSSHLMVLASGRISLSNADPVNGHRPSVDVAFESIAKVYGPRAAGIVLTGMGSDGAAGLLAMRHAGAVTMVQNEESCVVFGMPRAAIDVGAAERIVTPAGLVESLRTLHRERMGSRPR